jgi:uncharacterized protein YsxB (DUF464 family)
MVKVRLKRGSNGDVCGFRMEGHSAGTVCAAASALSFNLVNSIETLTSAKCEVVMPKKRTGYLDVCVPELESGSCHDASVLMKSFVIGIAAIEEEFPKELKISG